jgi:hypothetical protein
MQIPILNGIYTDSEPDFRISYPVNLVPVSLSNGISAGYLRPGEGLVEEGTGPGIDRGAINWNNKLYRVMGSKLVYISATGVLTVIGDVGNDGKPVTFDYSFDRLAIASNENLFYYDGTTLSQVTDPDLGTVLDVVWVDGYFMTTDGEFIVVTDLSDPFAVNPLKYGSSEVDPDPVVAVLKLRNEIYAINRHTIEVFDNVGGSLFPFARIDGAQVQRGCVGTHACCEFIESIAFVGSGRNEQPGVYLGASSQTVKISTSEVDTLLSDLTDVQISAIVLESRKDKNAQTLYLHLPDRTLAYDAFASQVTGTPVWYVLTSSIDGFSQYRGRHFVWVYGKQVCADPTTGKYGHVDDTVSTHWGTKVRWEFGTTIIYNEGRHALFHELELVALTGRIAEGITPTISTSYSLDGVTYSDSRSIQAGTTGQRQKRLVWRRQGSMDNWRIQRFSGNSDAHIAFARLEVQLEGLNY